MHSSGMHTIHCSGQRKDRTTNLKDSQWLHPVDSWQLLLEKQIVQSQFKTNLLLVVVCIFNHGSFLGLMKFSTFSRVFFHETQYFAILSYFSSLFKIHVFKPQSCWSPLNWI